MTEILLVGDCHGNTNHVRLCRNGCGRPVRKVGYCDPCYCTARRKGEIVTVNRSHVLLPIFQPNREQLAWAAGFVDGEGSFMLHGRSPLLSVPQSGDDAPRQLQRFIDALVLGGKVEIHHRRQHPHHQQAYRVRITGFERVQAAAARLWPWLSEAKRAQALRVFAEYHEHWMPPGARRKMNNAIKKESA